MAKDKRRSFLLNDDEFDLASRKIEKNTTAVIATEVKPTEKNQPVVVKSKIKDKNLHKANKKNSRTKNPFYDAAVNIPLDYLQGGTTHARVLSSFIKPLKKWCAEKTAPIQDVINIAVYRFMLAEGIIKKPVSPSETDKK